MNLISVISSRSFPPLSGHALFSVVIGGGRGRTLETDHSFQEALLDHFVGK
ncbi:MAG: hypothetical protein ABI415_05450 [Flavitalea sp.]